MKSRNPAQSHHRMRWWRVRRAVLQHQTRRALTLKASRRDINVVKAALCTQIPHQALVKGIMSAEMGI